MKFVFPNFNAGEDTDWTRVFLTGLLFMFVLNIVMFVGLFGWTAVAILVISFLVITNAVAIGLLLRSARILTATEDAMQIVLDNISDMGTEFDQALRDTVWMEDVPQARKASKLLYDAKFTLLNAPATFHNVLHNTLGNELGIRYSSDYLIDSDEVLQPDDEFIEQLKAELFAREAEESNNEPSQFARPIS